MLEDLISSLEHLFEFAAVDQPVSTVFVGNVKGAATLKVLWLLSSLPYVSVASNSQ